MPSFQRSVRARASMKTLLHGRGMFSSPLAGKPYHHFVLLLGVISIAVIMLVLSPSMSGCNFSAGKFRSRRYLYSGNRIDCPDIHVGPDTITDPAFLVTRNMEDLVTWVDTSKIKRNVLQYNEKVDDYDLLN